MPVMANLREAMASTALASLEWNPDWERAVDRVAASGRVEPLGLAIWKARYMIEASGYRRAREGLTAIYRSRYRRDPLDFALKLVDHSLHEYIFQFCRNCRGVREVMLEQRRVFCPTCAGSGLKRYSDGDRARALGISYAQVKHAAHKFSWMLNKIADLDREVNVGIARELERGIDSAKSAASIASA